MHTLKSLALFPAAALVALSACADSPTAPATRAAPVAAAGALRVTTTELNTTAELNPIIPLAINSSGTVVGRALLPQQTNFRAFRWQNGDLTSLGLLPNFQGCCDSQASAINARGDIVGWSGENAPGLMHAFFWRDGVMTDLGTLPDVGPVTGPTGSWATGVNARGEVVGTSQFNGELGPNAHAFFWRGVGDAMNDLGTLPGGYGSGANAINSSSDVVGFSWAFSDRQRAVLWQHGIPGKAIDLGTLGGPSEATAINSSGDIAGWSETSTGATHAFLWRNGTMTDLGTLGGTWSKATGVGTSGDVVGVSTTATGATHAFFWRNGVMTDLTPSAVFSQASGINSSGDVVGTVSPQLIGISTAVIWTIK